MRILSQWSVPGRKLIGVAACLGMAGTLLAAAPQPAAAEKTGLAVGSQAPEFSLQDQTGRARSLADTLKSGPVAVVFYRSADW